MRRLIALLLIFSLLAVQPMPAVATSTNTFSTGAFSNYLNTSQYSSQVSQITNLSSQYQNSMQQYQGYMNQYDSLVNKWKSSGMNAAQQSTFMAQGQQLLTQAGSSYMAATNYASQINGLVSSLQSNLGNTFNVNNSISQLTNAAGNMSSLTNQLGSINSQLASLQSMAGTNAAMLSQVQSMQTLVNGMTSQLGGLQSSLANAVTGLAGGLNVNSSLNSVVGKFNNINGLMSGLQLQVNGIAQGALGSLGSSVNVIAGNLTSSIGSLGSSLNGMAGQVTGAASSLTGNLGSQLGSSLNALTGMNSQYGSFDGGSGNGSGSGSGNGIAASLQQPAQQQRNVANDFKTSNTNSPNSSSGGGNNNEEEDFIGFIPDEDPDVYWLKEEEGNNSKPTCDEIRGTYGNTPVTVNGACANSAYRIGYTGADMSEYFMKAVKTQDGSQSYKGDSVGYKISGKSANSAPMSMGQFYPGAYGLPRTFINNWGQAAGEDLLIKKTDMNSAVASDDGSTGFFKEEEKKKVFDKKTGQQREYFSTAYKDNEDALTSGACQLIAIHGGGKYKVKSTENGTYEMTNNVSTAQSSYSVVPERIVNARHPYAPRDAEDWTDKYLITYENSDYSTQICGHDELLDSKAWENGGQSSVTATDDDGDSYTYNASSSNSDIAAEGGDVGGMNADYEYYDKPIIDKGGKILVNNTRYGQFEGVYWAVFIACYYATYGMAASECDQLAKRVGCRTVILPPVKPDNYLKMSYNKQDAGDELPYIYDSTGDDFGYPDTTGSNAGAWAQGYIGLGTSWHQILPHANFGYNMPPLYHWPTKKAGSIPLIQDTPDYPGKKSKEGWATDKWEYWRTTITGVNSRFKPDESNPEEIGVHNFGAMFGEWNELVMYQANCNRFFGLNCICDYFKNFYKGSAMGYAMSRASGQIAIGNEAHNEYLDVNTENLGGAFQQHIYKSNTEKSDVATWERILNVKKGKQMFPALIGKKMVGSPGGEASTNWPGEGGFRMVGLDNAKVGDIIVWDNNETMAGGHKRPLHAAFVERTMNKEDGSKCIQVSESNNGVIRDAAGNTENWGRVTTRWMCSANDTGYTFNQEGAVGLKDCANTQMSTCWEKQWGQWIVYRYKDDTQRVTDPKTGEVKDGSSCQTDAEEFNTAVEEVKATQSGGMDDQVRDDTGKVDENLKNPKIKEAKDSLKKLTDKGCPPDMKYLLKDRNFRAGGITTGQYIPTAPNEPVSLFDFIYNIRLDSIFQLWSLLPKPQVNITPPKITFEHNKPEGSSSSSSGGTTLDTNKLCGELATEYAAIVKNTSGVTYKDGCAGNQPVGGSTASCNGTEFGRYGLIYAAYNNDKHQVNVDGLWNTAPAHAAISGDIVAFNNKHENKVGEPNGCRITNLSSCAKKGDIVLVQAGNNTNRLTPYNRFLIYDGGSQFYEVQESGSPVVRLGSLPGEYANYSYEVRHLSCNQ